MSQWYPGSGQSYTEYLTQESFVRDINGQIRSAGRGVELQLQAQSRQVVESLVANSDQLTRTFGDAFDSISGALHYSTDQMEEALGSIDYTLDGVKRAVGAVQASINSLHASFNHSMGLLLASTQVNNRLLSDLLDRLDAIHHTLESPMMTRAREYYRIGCKNLGVGLLDKALEAFLESEKIYDADCFTQYQMGKLYLYGVDGDDNVVNLEEAKRHLLLAARYYKAEVQSDPSFKKFAAEALFFASAANYAMIGEPANLSNSDRRATLLEEALQLTLEATGLDPELSQANYHSAKYAALIGDTATVNAQLEKAIFTDVDYALVVNDDHAFDAVRKPVEEVIAKCNTLAREKTDSRIGSVIGAVTDADSWFSDDSSLFFANFEETKEIVRIAQEHFASNTLFGYRDAWRLADIVNTRLEIILFKRRRELCASALHLLSEAKELPEDKGHSGDLNRLINNTRDLISDAEGLVASLSHKPADSHSVESDVMHSIKEYLTDSEKLTAIVRDEHDAESLKGSYGNAPSPLDEYLAVGNLAVRAKQTSTVCKELAAKEDESRREFAAKEDRVYRALWAELSSVSDILIAMEKIPHSDVNKRAMKSMIPKCWAEQKCIDDAKKALYSIANIEIDRSASIEDQARQEAEKTAQYDQIRDLAKESLDRAQSLKSAFENETSHESARYSAKGAGLWLGIAVALVLLFAGAYRPIWHMQPSGWEFIGILYVTITMVVTIAVIHWVYYLIWLRFSKK